MTASTAGARALPVLGSIGTVTVVGAGRAGATATEILRVLGATVDTHPDLPPATAVSSLHPSSLVICDVIDAGVSADYAEAVAARGRGVWVTVSAFGLDGPLGGERGSDLVSAAAGGLLSTVTDPDGRYYPMPGEQALQVAGQAAALALLHGVSMIADGAASVHLDVSAQEAVAFCAIQQEVAHHLYECRGPAGAARYATPSGIFPCTDGEIGIIVLDDHQWRRASAVFGKPSWPAEFPGVAERLANREHINAAVSQWTGQRSKFVCEQLLQSGGVAAVALRTLDDVRQLGQFEERGFIRDSADGLLRTETLPGLVSPGAPARADRAAPRSLRGLKVAEASNVLAGPLTGAMLGAMGADVVRLEEEQRLDIYRRNGPFKHAVAGLERAAYFLMANYSKRSVAAGIGVDSDRAAAICDWADVLLENLGTRRLEQIGIRSKQMFADSGKCSVTISGFGRVGPCSDYKAYAPNVHAFGGLTKAVQQRAGADATMRTSFADYCVAVWGATVAAAWWLGRGAEGCALDVSMAEVVAAKLNGLALVPSDPRVPDAGTEFLVRCPDGSQVALSTLVAAGPDAVIAALGLGGPGTVTSQAADATVLDARGAAGWPDGPGLLELAAKAAIPMTAYLAKTPVQVLDDAQLTARGFLVALEHPEVGTSYVFALPWKEALRPRTGYRRAPLLGEDDGWMDDVLSRLGGLR